MERVFEDIHRHFGSNEDVPEYGEREVNGSSLGRRVRSACIVALCLVVVACSSAPIALRRVSPKVAYRASTANALSAGEPSNPTRIVLRRHDLMGHGGV